MSSLGAQTLYSPEEYLYLERKAIFKSEYLRGEILAMSGTNRAHNYITLDIATEINIQLRDQNCDVFSGDMRVKERVSEAYFYPDVVVSCAEPQFEDETFDTLLNPVVIIEVLSSYTEIYDRTEKFNYYKQIPTLKEYILVSQDEVQVEYHQKLNEIWILKEYHSLEDTLTLSTLSCSLSLRDVYRRVDIGKIE